MILCSEIAPRAMPFGHVFVLQRITAPFLPPAGRCHIKGTWPDSISGQAVLNRVSETLRSMLH